MAFTTNPERNQTDRTKLAGSSRVRRDEKGRKRYIKTQEQKHTQAPVLFVLMNTSVYGSVQTVSI